ATRRLSAGWLLNSKAIAQQTLAQRTLLARDNTDPASASLVRELLDVRRQLANLSFTQARPGEEGQQQRQRATLQTREQELSRSLGHGSVSTDVPTWVELEAVRGRLPADAVLIDIVRFKRFRFQAKGNEPAWDEPRYVAWVVPSAGKGEVQIIDLG